MKAFGKGILLFLVGGLIYFWLEVLWRGYSHWSMFLLGGLCFVLCGLINEGVSWEMPLPLQMLISALMITALGLFQAARSAVGADQPEIQRDLVPVVQCGNCAGRLAPLLVFRRRQAVLSAEVKDTLAKAGQKR